MANGTDEVRCTARDGFPLAVQIAGPAEGPALLLLAGQANSHHWWDGLRPFFEGRYRTVTFDQRGTGGSRGPVGRWSTSSFAEDAVDVLDGLGISRVHVYGTSMGGRVGQHLAARHPERVAALVLACTTAGGSHGVDRDPAVGRALAAATPAARHQVLHELFFTPSCPSSVRTTDLLGDPSMTPQEAAAHRRTSREHDAGELLRAITAPTLVLHGEDDRMTPVENGVRLANGIPGAASRFFPGLRHGFFAERADLVSAEVVAFLRAHDSR